MKRVASLILCALLTGCVGTDIPIAHLERGHKYGMDAIVFLNEAGTTRADVVANLGVPTDEFTEAGVMAYTWVTSRPYGGFYYMPHPSGLNGEFTLIEPKEVRKIWALFIAYDSRQSVISHAVRSFPASKDLKAEALDWARTLSR